jgi:hypothetical protein
MADGEATETLTYRELAERLGIGLKAAKARAKRHEDAGRWFRFQGNDGKTHVRVPVEDLENAEASPGHEADHVVPNGPDHEAPHTDGWAAYQAATDGTIADLRARLDAAERARDEAVADARAARQDAEDARVEAARQRQRADLAEQALEGARRQAEADQIEAAELRGQLQAQARRGLLARIFGRGGS